MTRIIIAFALFLMIIFQAFFFLSDRIHLFQPKTPDPIKVGLIYSTTGPRAYKEVPVQEATLMAINEINLQGGLLGKKIVPIIKDAQSKWKVIRKEIEELIKDEQVEVIFGCGVPSIQYTIKDIFEHYNHLLINPFQYDGLVWSSHLIFTGTAINQQVAPALHYCFENFGNRFFFVGSDHILPHVIAIMVRDHIEAKQGQLLGEVFISIESGQVDESIAKIIEQKPDVILINILGDDNFLFFKKLREAGIEAKTTPVFSFNTTEIDLAYAENIEDFIGHYSIWNYFQSIDSELNKKFINNFTKISKGSVIDNAAESAYFSVYLWAKAVQELGHLSIDDLDYTFDNIRIQAPEGPVTLDAEGTAAWKYSRIGKIQPNRQFEIVWESNQPIRPIPYQLYRSQEEWHSIANQLHNRFENEIETWYH